nr:type II toxin-antitoxin system CcdA family antitoxin [Candidatus Njordarchaeum guaymaensis]
MSKKVISTIYLDEEVLKRAKEVGLNISKICENALKEAIYLLESENVPRRDRK